MVQDTWLPQYIPVATAPGTLVLVSGVYNFGSIDAPVSYVNVRSVQVHGYTREQGELLEICLFCYLHQTSAHEKDSFWFTLRCVLLKYTTYYNSRALSIEPDYSWQ